MNFLRNTSVSIIQPSSCPTFPDHTSLRQLITAQVKECALAITSSEGEFKRLLTPKCLLECVSKASNLEAPVEIQDGDGDHVSYNSSLHDVLECFVQSGRQYLAVIDGVKFLGVISAQQFIESTIGLFSRFYTELEGARKEISNLDTYVSYVAHDMRGPLSVIISVTTLLEKFAKQSTQEEYYIRLIRDVSSRTIRYADTLLEFNKYRSTGFKLAYRQTTISEFLKRIAEENEASVKFRGLSLIIECGRDGEISIDADVLSHALQNLVDNACKYSKKNSTVSMYAELQDSGNHTQTLVLRVHDEGCGFSAEHARKVFEPYVRIPNAQGIGGAGLGLCIVKTFVDLHRGQIDVQSAENEGTTFILRIPAQSPPAPKH